MLTHRTLRQAMEELLDGWRTDLDAAWAAALLDVSPDFDGMNQQLDHADTDLIFPGRKGKPVPGAPPRAHIFRALDGTTPDTVKAVVIGQDPYPNVAWATGRAFEQGGLTDWTVDPRQISESLERIVPVVAAARTGDDDYGDLVNHRDAWKRVADDVRAGTLNLQAPHQIFDHWQREGVLFLNSGLTLSRFEPLHQKEGHIPLWAPVVKRILTRLVDRPRGHLVFICWGGVARDFLEDTGIEKAARKAGTWGVRVAAVHHPHPAAEDRITRAPLFFRRPNPFLEANEALTKMGAEAIRW